MGKHRPTRRKLAQFFNWRLRVTLTCGRVIEGIIMGVDKHLNLVLKDAEETIFYKVKCEENRALRRTLGMIVLRGNEILHVIALANTGQDLCDTPAVMEKKNVAQARARSNKQPPPGVSAIVSSNDPGGGRGMPHGMGRGMLQHPGSQHGGGGILPMMPMPGMIRPGMPGLLPGMIRPPNLLIRPNFGGAPVGRGMHF